MVKPVIDINFGFCGDLIAGIIICDTMELVIAMRDNFDDLESNLRRQLQQKYSISAYTYTFRYSLISRQNYKLVFGLSRLKTPDL